ncbi:MAG: TetR/AcrR family transcriptional regulator [Clostridia bacterium]|nr:TetR/AcrR family transcriptional regulator [Clostridia bacterium]
MPKIIDNLRDNILKVSKQMLLNEGYIALTMRKISCECHVALGTLYNYFPSKDMIVAAIMLEDWKKVTEEFEKASIEASSAIEGIKTLYTAIEEFSNRYSPAWSEYKGDPVSQSPDKHQMLIFSISGKMSNLLNRFNLNYDPYLSEFLSETILRHASYGQKYEKIEIILNKLLLA